jgi:hypothetical protein
MEKGERRKGREGTRGKEGSRICDEDSKEILPLDLNGCFPLVITTVRLISLML